jgi:hypothetical protein
MSKQPDRNAGRTKLEAKLLKASKYEEIADLVENDCSIVPGAGTTGIPASNHEYDVETINKEFAVVLTGSRGMILKISPTGPTHDRVRIMRPDAIRLWFQNCFTEIIGANGKPRRVTWATAWLADKRRRKYAGIEFFPNPDNVAGTPGYFNLWRGFDVKPSPTDSYAIFKDHLLTNVCGEDAGLFEYLFAWFAHIVQRPRERIGIAIVLRGKKGAGKTKIGEVIGSLFPAHYLLIDDPRYIIGQFNVHMANCLLLQADEAIWAGDKHAEGRLKGLITSETQMIEAKGLDSFQLKNYVRVLMTSEEDWVVPAGKDERRFLVLDVAPNVAQNHEYFAAMNKELTNGGKERLLHDLLNFDLGRVNLRQEIGIELVGEDHGDGGIDALAHFHLRHDQRGLAGMIDADEGVRRKLAGGVVGRLLRLVGGFERQAECEHEAAGHSARHQRATRGKRADIARHRQIHGGLLCLSVRRALDRLADAHIGAAAADVARHRRIDIGIVGARRTFQQRRRRHDLTGLAIAALDHFQIEPRLLRLGSCRRSADALDRGDGAVADGADRQQARAHGFAVEVHRAGAALRDAAAEFRAGESQEIAQHPKQRHIIWRVEIPVFSIDFQCRHGKPPACWATSAHIFTRNTIVQGPRCFVSR